MNKKNSISIIIPNYNGKHLLQKNLPAVIKASKKAEIIIVDDASTDNSIEFLKKTYPDIILIQKKRNEGFSSTVNLGVSLSQSDIVVLLNTDIEPEENFLDPLCSHFNNPQVFAIGCMDKSIEAGKIILRGRGEAAWRHGFFIHRRGDVEKSTSTAWVSGGSGAFRRNMWMELQGLDTLYNPFYWEDIDLSYRARKAGYTIIFERRSVVFHTHEEGSIRKNADQKKITTISYRNQLLFIWKNITDPTLILDHLRNLPIQIVKSILRGDITFIKGLLLAVTMIPEVLEKRNKKVLAILKDSEILSKEFS